MMTVKHKIFAIRAVKAAVVNKNTSVRVIRTCIVVRQIILIISVIILIPKNGIINLRIINLNPADNIIINFLKGIPVNSFVLFAVTRVAVILLCPVCNFLNFTVKLGVSAY